MIETSVFTKFFNELDGKTQFAILNGFAYMVIPEDIESMEIFFDYKNSELFDLQKQIIEMIISQLKKPESE